MNHPTVPARLRQVLAALGIGLLAAVPLAAGAQPRDLVTPTADCTPSNPYSQAAVQRPAKLGVVRRDPGPITPPSSLAMLLCPVKPPPEGTPAPATLRLTYSDNTALRGNVEVRLMAKSRARTAGDPPLGSTLVVGRIVSQPTVGVAVQSAGLSAPLDFQRFSYWFEIDMQPVTGSSAVVDVHELSIGY